MSFMEELKRRNVFKVGVAYLALGWLVIQVTDMAVPALNLPEELNSIVFYLGIIGFPFALFFAWAFELTPDGLARTGDVDEEASVTGQTGQKINKIIIATLSLAVVVLLTERFLVRENTAPSDSMEGMPSIAVLAFENTSEDPNQEYFADGISEEILNLLAKTEAMKVAGRTSSFSFKDKVADIPEIAEALNVNHVLEGSIRKSGNTLRITAQLIRDDGYHMWSETYDREITDIFKIQDEISAAILTELRVQLLNEERVIEAKRGTENVEAYEKYLLARELIRRRSTHTIEQAAEVLREVIEIDPLYAEAYAQLGITYNLLENSQYGHYTREESFAGAEKYLSIAERIDPNNIEVLAGRGLQYLEVENDKALIYLERARSIDPNHESALRWLGNVYNILGEVEKNYELNRAVYLADPLWVAAINNYTRSTINMGYFEEAEALIARMEQLDPNSLFVGNQRGYLLTNKGLLADAIIAHFEYHRGEPNSFNINTVKNLANSLEITDFIPSHIGDRYPEVYFTRGELDKYKVKMASLIAPGASFDQKLSYINNAQYVGWVDEASEAIDMLPSDWRAKLMNDSNGFVACWQNAGIATALRLAGRENEIGELNQPCENYLAKIANDRNKAGTYWAMFNHAIAKNDVDGAVEILKAAPAKRETVFLLKGNSLDILLGGHPDYKEALAAYRTFIDAEAKKVRDYIAANPEKVEAFF